MQEQQNKSYKQILDKYLKENGYVTLDKLLRNKSFNFTFHMRKNNLDIIVESIDGNVIYIVNGKEISKEEFYEVKKNNCNNTNKKKTRKRNIYDAITYLNNSPVETKLIMKIKNNTYNVKLNKDSNFVIVDKHNNETRLFELFDDNEILFAMFEEEPKEKWIDCNLKGALLNYENENKIKAILDKGEYIYKKGDTFFENHLYSLMINNCRWQYLKKED